MALVWVHVVRWVGVVGVIRVSQEGNENQTKNAQGVVLMAGASRIWKLVKSNLLRVCDVDLL